MTDEQLGEIGAKAAAGKSVAQPTIAVSSDHGRYYYDQEARTAFARAVREAVVAELDESHTPWGCNGETWPVWLERQVKKVQELEEKLAVETSEAARYEQQARENGHAANEACAILNRIRSLPEKWKSKELAHSGDWFSYATLCANELAAALGESKVEHSPPTDRINGLTWKELCEQLAHVWWNCHKHGVELQHGDWNADGVREHLTFSIVTPNRCFHAETPQKAFDKWRESVRESVPSHVDKYAELKAAHKAGKVIQWKRGDKEWTDFVGQVGTLVFFDYNQYRIKPLPPVFVPLEAKDVQEGDLVKYADNGISREVMAVHKGYVVHIQELGSMRAISYEVLAIDWLISRDGGKTWEPCKKLREAAQ